MRRLKAFIRKFFSLSRGETNGFLILVPLMAIILFSEPIFRVLTKNQSTQETTDQGLLDSLISQWKWEKEKTDSAKAKSSPKFSFDPNKASKEELIQLGFSPSLSQRIINYHSKGGVFRIQSDLLKIYGMDTVFYGQLLPFITLPKQLERPQFPAKKEVADLPKTTKFDINLADTAQLKKIYGIGNVLSVRIINYRDHLGGFVSNDQLQEVYGLDSAVLKKLNEKVFISNDFQPHTLNVNNASEKELALHPYIKSKLAKAITSYRFQHGSFAKIEDLQKIALINHETFGKIKPYLVVE